MMLWSTICDEVMIDRCANNDGWSKHKPNGKGWRVIEDSIEQHLMANRWLTTMAKHTMISQRQ